MTQQGAPWQQVFLQPNESSNFTFHPAVKEKGSLQKSGSEEYFSGKTLGETKSVFIIFLTLIYQSDSFWPTLQHPSGHKSSCCHSKYEAEQSAVFKTSQDMLSVWGWTTLYTLYIMQWHLPPKSLYDLYFLPLQKIWNYHPCSQGLIWYCTIHHVLFIPRYNHTNEELENSTWEFETEAAAIWLLPLERESIMVML